MENWKNPFMAPTPNAIFTSITPKQIRVIGVPLDLGQSRRGVDMGPSAVRVAGLEGRVGGGGGVVGEGGGILVLIVEQKKKKGPRAADFKGNKATRTEQTARGV